MLVPLPNGQPYLANSTSTSSRLILHTRIHTTLTLLVTVTDNGLLQWNTTPGTPLNCDHLCHPGYCTSFQMYLSLCTVETLIVQNSLFCKMDRHHCLKLYTVIGETQPHSANKRWMGFVNLFSRPVVVGTPLVLSGSISFKHRICMSAVQIINASCLEAMFIPIQSWSLHKSPEEVGEVKCVETSQECVCHCY